MAFSDKNLFHAKFANGTLSNILTQNPSSRHRNSKTKKCKYSILWFEKKNKNKNAFSRIFNKKISVLIVLGYLHIN